MDTIRLSDDKIRRYLGHNGVECRVRITGEGRVERFGSPDPSDRSKDFWQFMGYRSDIVAHIFKPPKD